MYWADRSKPCQKVVRKNADNTQTVIASLVKKHRPNIRSLNNQSNKGCPATRNVGIRSAKNNLIFNLDSDNILAPNSIVKLKKALLKNQAQVATFAQYNYFINSTKLVTHYWKCKTLWLTLPDIFAGHINPGPGGNFLYTKDSWAKIGGYSELGRGLHEAWGFTLKQLCNGNKIFVVPKTHYFHRHGHESLFVSESKNKVGEHEILLQMIAPFRKMFTPKDWNRIEADSTWLSI